LSARSGLFVKRVRRRAGPLGNRQTTAKPPQKHRKTTACSALRHRAGTKGPTTTCLRPHQGLQNRARKSPL